MVQIFVLLKFLYLNQRYERTDVFLQFYIQKKLLRGIIIINRRLSYRLREKENIKEMLNPKRSKLASLIFVSAILSIALAQTYEATPTIITGNAACLSGSTKFTVFSDTTLSVILGQSCIPQAHQVYDCLKYLSNGTCLCNEEANSKLIPIMIIPSANTKWGCVPIDQQRLNGKCTYQSAKKYQCVCSDATYKYSVTMDITDSNNLNKVAQGCAPEEVPNCEKWKIYSSSTPNIQILQTNSDYDGWKIVCSNCLAGYKAFASKYENGFTYQTYTGTVTGIGCPLDNTYHLDSCKTMTYSSGKYQCTCTSPNPNRVTFTTYDSQTITQGCSSKSVQDCSTYTYNNDMTKVKCNACKNPANSSVTILGSDSGSVKYRQICFPTASLPKNCLSYYANDAANSISTSSKVECYACNTDFDKVPSNVYDSPLPGTAISSTGFCVTKGRWIIEESLCKKYNLLQEDSNRRANNTYLVCNKCNIQSGNAPPCYKENLKASISSPSKTCTGGQLTVLKKDDTANGHCISAGIIDNCKIYTDITGSTTYTGKGCDTCLDGYTKVDTQFSHQSITGYDKTKMICVLTTKLDANCQIYDNEDLTCYRCKNGLNYDTNLKRCRTATDASQGCQTPIRPAATSCDKCKAEYTFDQALGVCHKTVQYCAKYNASGCSECIDKFKRVCQKCVRLPLNCNQVNCEGTCVTHNGQGAINIQQTCEDGKVRSNGACVPKIEFCQTYTTDSKCGVCKSGKNPSADGSSCVKACPPNTAQKKYKQNRSDKSGNCVQVDINCREDGYIDDGGCYQCFQNYYADKGICIKLNLTGNRN